MTEKDKHTKDIPVDFLEEEKKSGTQEETVSEMTESKKKAASKKKTEDGYKKKYEEYKKKYEEMLDQYLRLRAEFANYKKRVEREKIEYSHFIKSEIIRNLLPVLDDFNHMLEKAGEGSNEKSVLEGARMIYEKFHQVLEAEGLEKIDSLGQEFDPQIHEAMMVQKTDKEEDHNKIISVFQEGYKVKDRLLRPSKVVVGKYEKSEESGN